MRSFSDMKNEKDLMSWDEAQRIVNFHLMTDHMQEVGITLTESELDMIFDWSFETAYDSENYCYNFDTVNFALLSYCRDKGIDSLRALLIAGDGSVQYEAIVGLVNEYCDLDNDYKKINL